MADTFAPSDMDAFLINPTTKMSKEYAASPTANTHDLSSANLVRLLSTVSKRDFGDAYPLPQEYTSEEEASSPTDNDYSGFGSSSSDAESIHSFDELDSDEDYDAHIQSKQLCASAQRVQLVSVGKAKVIDVPRSSIELSSPESSPRSLTERIDNGQVIFGSSKSLQRAQMASRERLRTSPSTTSPVVQTAFEPRAVRRKVNVPRLDAAPTSTPVVSKLSQTPLANQRVTSPKQDPFPADWPLPASPTSPTSPSKRRMPKLSTSFSLRALGNPRRNPSTSSTSSRGTSGEYQFDRTAAVSASPTIDELPRQASKSKVKLVPRGASERAPPLVLPPCPDGGGPTRVVEESPLEARRRKSLSAAFVMTQA